jgi:hypothetical protein
VPEPIQAGWHPRSGYQAGQLLAGDPEVIAVLCGNDDLALGVIRAMREAGRAVPGSVSVVGFDDIPQAAFLTPALSTVLLDFTERTVRIIRRRIDDPAFSPDQRAPALDRVMAAITGPKHLNKRRDRTYPRVVKRVRHNSYRVKKPGRHGTRHDAPATIKLLNPALTSENTSIAALPKTS